MAEKNNDVAEKNNDPKDISLTELKALQLTLSKLTQDFQTLNNSINIDLKNKNLINAIINDLISAQYSIKIAISKKKDMMLYTSEELIENYKNHIKINIKLMQDDLLNFKKKFNMLSENHITLFQLANQNLLQRILETIKVLFSEILSLTNQTSELKTAEKQDKRTCNRITRNTQTLFSSPAYHTLKPSTPFITPT